jgi:hypothetical protein
LLVEKDSFTILALQAPCPEAFKASAVGNNEPICSLEFRYEVNSSMQVPSSVSLKIDSRELMVLKINRVLLNPAEKLVRELTKATPNDTSDANAAFAKTFTSAFLQ